MLTIDVEHHPDGTASIAAIGDVDAATAARLSATVHRELDRRPRTLVLDLRKVTFLGVAGLRVLLCVADRTAAGGGPVEVRYGDPSPVRSALDAAGMTALLPTARPADVTGAAPKPP